MKSHRLVMSGKRTREESSPRYVRRCTQGVPGSVHTAGCTQGVPGWYIPYCPSTPPLALSLSENRPVSSVRGEVKPSLTSPVSSSPGLIVRLRDQEEASRGVPGAGERDTTGT